MVFEFWQAAIKKVFGWVGVDPWQSWRVAVMEIHVAGHDEERSGWTVAASGWDDLGTVAGMIPVRRDVASRSGWWWSWYGGTRCQRLVDDSSMPRHCVKERQGLSQYDGRLWLRAAGMILVQTCFYAIATTFPANQSTRYVIHRKKKVQVRSDGYVMADAHPAATKPNGRLWTEHHVTNSPAPDLYKYEVTMHTSSVWSGTLLANMNWKI